MATDPEPYTYGKPFAIAELKKRGAAERPLNKRDTALVKAIREAAAAAESQVIPFYLGPDDKVPTAKLAAKRLAARLDVPVKVGTHRSYPGVLLLTRGKLRGSAK